jgi:hypothetical protein
MGGSAERARRLTTGGTRDKLWIGRVTLSRPDERGRNIIERTKFTASRRRIAGELICGNGEILECVKAGMVVLAKG